jgi:hypothetical protein
LRNGSKLAAAEIADGRLLALGNTQKCTNTLGMRERERERYSLRMGIHPGSGILVVCCAAGWERGLKFGMPLLRWLRNYPARTHHQEFCWFALVLVCAMTQLVCVYVIWLQLEMVSARCIIKIIMIMGWGALSHVPLSPNKRTHQAVTARGACNILSWNNFASLWLLLFSGETFNLHFCRTPHITFQSNKAFEGLNCLIFKT